MDTWLLILCFVGILLYFFFTGFPVGFSLALTSIILMILGIGTGLNSSMIVSIMFRSLDSFILLSLPFFLLAGRIMNETGITERIFYFCREMVGSLKGGMGHVNIIASMIFAGMSGIAIADAAGLGTIEYKAMKDEGYPTAFSIGITASSATIGPIIPPSIPLVVYAVLAGVSVGRILVAGLFPGILIGIILMIMVSITAHKNNYPHGEKFNIRKFIFSLKRGILALVTPAILLTGILTGIVTVIEASALAVLYAIILGVFIYREISWSKLWEMCKDTFIDSTTVVFLLATSSVYGYTLVHTRIPIILAEKVLTITNNPMLILIIINIFLLFIGMFMESISAISILVPVLLPLIKMSGIDPLHFGVVMVFNLMIGLLTPPFGQILFVLNKALNVKLETILKGVIPFYLPLFFALIIITFFPQIVLFLPKIIFK
jgi:tripartite ATP-independent transporter DctM subunit